MKTISLIQKQRYEKRLPSLLERKESLRIELANAKERGDLRENSEVDATEQDLRLVTIEIKKIEESLKLPVAEYSDSPIIDIGSFVTVKNVDTGVESLFLVENEGNSVTEGILSTECILGRKILGNSSGVYTIITETKERIRYEVVKQSKDVATSFIEMYPGEDMLDMELNI